MIKLFLSDIDGTLTDGTVFVGENGEKMKQFSHRDGRGFYLLKNNTDCIAGLITSETGGINAARAKKLLKLGTIEYFFDGSALKTKIDIIKDICAERNISLSEVAFIGDDTNDKDVLSAVGIAACPNDAVDDVINIPEIYITKKKGGRGAVREFIDLLIKQREV
jgi:N-acylneuraminate cytidylyltransferase